MILFSDLLYHMLDLGEFFVDPFMIKNKYVFVFF